MTRAAQPPCPRRVGRWLRPLVSLSVAAALVTASYSYSQDTPTPQQKAAEAKVKAKAKKAKAAELAAKAAAAAPTPAPAPAPAPVVAKTTPAVKLPNMLDVAALTGRINQRIGQRLAAEQTAASPQASDAEFLRRLYLDLLGVIPSAEKAAEFLDSKDPQKRAKLIDELLANEKYGTHFADIWQAIMLPRDSANRRLQAKPLIDWLKDNFNKNTPWNTFVSDLVTALGTQEQNGAVTFFIANQTPDKFTDQVSRLFLGLQLQCAQCHNHPFTGWKQAEYWGMAQFFMKVRPDNVQRAAKMGASPGINEDGKGKARGLPEAAMTVPAKFLQGEQPKLDTSAPYRPVLAQWMTSANNPFFAKAMVNRMWQHFLGRGFVSPVDDMHENNPASHPDLLAELAEQFKASGFDLKHLIRAICSSQAYQRTSKPTGNNDQDVALFSHLAVKPLTPEQLFDSLSQVVFAGRQQQAAAANRKMGAGVGNDPRSRFINFFQADEGADPTEYQAGIPQALRLMNAAEFNRNAALLDKAVKLSTPPQVIEYLYLGTLSRRPTAEEAQRLTDFVSKNDTKQAYSDILWALLNSSEFALNH